MQTKVQNAHETSLITLSFGMRLKLFRYAREDLRCAWSFGYGLNLLEAVRKFGQGFQKLPGVEWLA